MSARTSNSNAYIVSATLHAAVVGLIALLALESQHPSPLPQKVMELVAGDGNNYGATVAPALGVADGIKLAIPSVPVPIVKSTPPPEPVATPPPEAVQPVPMTPATPVPPTTAPKHPVKAPPKTITKLPAKPIDPSHDFAKDVKRIADKREKRLVAAYEKQQALAAKRAELTREANAAKHVDAEGIKGGVVGGSTDNKEGGAHGHAMTREEGDLLAAYFALLQSRVKDNHVQPDGLSDSLKCKVSLYVARDGSISRVHIVRSSGNAEFDQSVVEAFNKTSSIGPRPDHNGDENEVEFSLKELEQ